MKPESPHYEDLTSEAVAGLSPQEAEKTVIQLLAERSRVKKGGKILSWGDFNENPDLLVNRMLATILLSQIPDDVFNGREAKHIAVLSIENSAVYLASQIALELERTYGLKRPPRLIRARKSYSLFPPSPAMGELVAAATVFPITSEGEARYLVASMSKAEDLSNIRVLVVVDDFRATGNSLRGGVDLGLELLGKAGVPMEEVTVVPVAGLGKPDQEEGNRFSDSGARILDCLTAVDIHFWADWVTGQAYIQANSFPPEIMKNATASDFTPV